MIRLKMKKYNNVNEEAVEYQPHHQAKLTSMNILQVKKYDLLIKKNNRTS